MENLTVTQTNEDNKLIAEFMNFKKGSGDAYINNIKLKYWYYLPKNLWYFDNEENDLIKEFFPNESKFSTNWDWLMPVIFKILDLKNIHAEEKQKVFNSINPNINKTYFTVIEFIKWYNKNKS